MASGDSTTPTENVHLDKVDSAFYTDGDKYWKEVEPTVDGMLGG